ncbi:MAG: hypothetical protein ACRCZ9_02800 [Fusobacteriaceae bacterium]
MKKLLTLLSLALTVSAFGAPTGNESKEATMNVTATVIKPLTIIVAQDMSFGTIIQGTEAKATGIYTLAGEPGAKVDIKTTFPEALSNNVSRSELPITFTALNNDYSLDNSGNLSVNINGSVTPTTATVTGLYEGTIVARVQYQ